MTRPVRRRPGAGADPEYGERIGRFRTEHRDLLAAPRWEDLRPPVRELLAAAGDAGLFSQAWVGEGALDRAVQLHTALARVGNGAPGAAVLTHLEVGARLLSALAPDQHRLTRLLAGNLTASLAATEPDGAGSDLAELATAVTARGDGLRVSGQKWFISNAHFADLLLVLAADLGQLTGPRPGPALLLVETAAPGVLVEPVLSAGHPGLTGRITLADAPISAVLAPAGQGVLHLARHWIHERVMLAVRMVELAAGVFDHAVADARQRYTFGVPLSTNQHVRFVLAGLLAEIAEVRAGVKQAVRLLASGDCTSEYAATCKYRAAELLSRVADEALQLAGADGYQTGHPAERALRDSLGLSLAGGTDEMMLAQIARTLG
jgi:alkylation response protein AidB-like acyl-CoA dehydrogenase